jgi:hypothetical protein
MAVKHASVFGLLIRWGQISSEMERAEAQLIHELEDGCIMRLKKSN